MASDDRDFSPVARTLTDDVLLREPASLPFGGDHRGHAGFERWLRTFSDVWSSMEIRGSELLVGGDQVTGHSHVHAVVRRTGRTIEWPLLQLFRIRDGKVAELRPFYRDTAAMLPALDGLET